MGPELPESFGSNLDGEPIDGKDSRSLIQSTAGAGNWIPENPGMGSDPENDPEFRVKRGSNRSGW